MALGLLVGAIAASGTGVLPRGVARIGLATAVLAEVTAVVLIWPALGVILPVARVLALTWLMVASVALYPAARRASAAR